MRVCLVTEGTFPYVRGGVSTWCRQLIAGLPDIDFVVYAIVGNPAGALEYDLPSNVSQLISVPLWGHERLDEYNSPDLGSRNRSREALKNVFLPLFRKLLEQIMRGAAHGSPQETMDAAGGLYHYFREHDYDWTMRRPETWETTITFFRDEPWHARFMTSLESIELLRSLYRYFIPLAIAIPTCDIVHTSASGLCGLVPVIARNVHATPTMLTEHGVYLRERVLELARGGFPFSDRVIKKNVFSSLAKAIYAASDVIAPVCSYNTQWENYYGASSERISVVYNGVDEHRFIDADYSPDTPTVVAVLRIDPLKDVLTLIASAVTVRKRIPNVRYRIWGPAPDLEYLALCTSLIKEFRLEEVVFFMGPTRNPAEAYAQAHVVALSSISEGFPYAIIEAMMCAKPVVATDVGGVREAINRFGVVVPPKRPERLGAAIADMLADPEHARTLGKGARDYALAHFTENKFLDNYRSLYGKLAAS